MFPCYILNHVFFTIVFLAKGKTKAKVLLHIVNLKVLLFSRMWCSGIYGVPKGIQKFWQLSQESNILRYVVTFNGLMCYTILFGSASNYFQSVWQLKKKLQLLTLGIGGIGVISAYISYTPEIAARQVYYHVFLILTTSYNCLPSFGINVLFVDWAHANAFVVFEFFKRTATFVVFTQPICSSFSTGTKCALYYPTIIT